MKTTPSIGVSQQKTVYTTRRYLLGLLLLFLCVIAVSAATTHYLAHQFSYSPQLPGHIRGQLFWPWSWMIWAWDYHETYPRLMERAALMFIIGMALAMAIYVVLLLRIRRMGKGVESLHGSARWAVRDEIVAAGLLPEKPGTNHPGVYVGAWFNILKNTIEYLRHNGPEHVLAFAPTRSGKGVGLVLPTLLSWLGSTVVYDIKGENWSLTAGWRQKQANNKVLKFEPTATDGSCARFNPLAEIRLDSPNDVRDAQNIVMLLVDPDGKGLNDHWSKKSFELMTALILHACYSIRNQESRYANMADIDAVLTECITAESPSDEEKDAITLVFEGMRDYKHHLETGNTHDLVAKTAQAMLNTPDKERGSIISSVTSYLSLYNDPTVRNNVSTSDWNIDDLMNHDQPVSLYLVVSPNDEARLRPLTRLIISMIINHHTESMAFEDGASKAGYKHRLLMLLDEFASLGKLDMAERALSYSAGFGVKFLLIIQDLDQINKVYGRENGIIGNCHIRIAYATNNLSTGEYLSKQAGLQTVLKESITTSGKRSNWVLSSTSVSTQEVQRPLITPDEASRLPIMTKVSVTRLQITFPWFTQVSVMQPGDMLIFAAGYPGIYGKQILYFTDPVFLRRARVTAPKASDSTLAAPGSPKAETAILYEQENDVPDTPQPPESCHLKTDQSATDSGTAHEKERLLPEVVPELSLSTPAPVQPHEQTAVISSPECTNDENEQTIIRHLAEEEAEKQRKKQRDQRRKQNQGYER